MTGIWKDSPLKGSAGRWNSSLVVCWARWPAWCSVVESFFPVEGIFSLRVNMGFLTPFPQNSYGFEYKPRPSLCTHAFHRKDWKDPDVHVLEGKKFRRQKHTRHAQSTKTECDYLNGWILKNSHIRKNLTQNDEPQIFLLGNEKKRKKKGSCYIHRNASASTQRRTAFTCFSSLRRVCKLLCLLCFSMISCCSYHVS